MKQTLQRVVWSEGMLMAPQHFQQQDAHHEALLDARLTWLAPHAWGVAALALDEAALATGQVALAAFAGVLPGGCALRLDGDDALPVARDVAAQLSAEAARVDVFLALPIERASRVGYASPDADAGRARYVIAARDVPDAVSGGRHEAIAFARPNVMLLLGDEPRDDCESIKIAEVVRDASGSLRFARSYVPPCLWLSASPHLIDRLGQLLATCVAKRRALVAMRRERDVARADFALDELTQSLLLRTLSRAIPGISSLIGSAECAPHSAYGRLMELAGELSVFAVDAELASLPAYVHTDLRGTFDALFARIGELLQITAVSRAVTLELDARVDGMHLGRLHDPALARPGTRFFLGVRCQLPRHAVDELTLRTAKVASWTEIPRYVSTAVSGVPMTACDRPPRELPARAERHYFALDADSAVWKAALAERTIAVHLPPPFEPTATIVELVAIAVDA